MVTTTGERSLTWLQKFMGPRPPGVAPPPPITAVEMIPERRKAIDLGALNVGLPELAGLHEEVVLRERAGFRLTAEVYVPLGGKPFPTLVYMHGGAFCVWSARDVRRIAVRLAAAGHVVINLNCGLAPEHPFPWAVEDAIYASRWAAVNAPRYGGVDGTIAIGGDSAGACLSCAAISFLAGGYDGELLLDEGDLAGTPVSFSAAFLHCGGFDMRARMQERDTTPGTTEVMANLAYLGTHFLAKHRDPLCSPYFAANLAAMPATYLSCGSDDPLLPQTLHMTQRLADEGVDVTTSIIPGVDHEFLLYDPRHPEVNREWEHALRWLNSRTGAKGRVSVG